MASAVAGRSVLIDLSNLRGGGGVQVGASFLDELDRLQSDGTYVARWPWLSDVVVEANSGVVANRTRPPGALHVEVVDGRPSSRLRRRPRRAAFDASFTVFGPDLGPRRARTNIVGFADVTSLFPEFAGVQGRGRLARLRVRGAVSRRRFRSADLVVAESAYVARALEDRWGIPARRSRVVPNVLHQVFHDVSLQQPLEMELPEGPVFGFPTRYYPHKNFGVLGAAARLLREEGRQVRFALTLTAEEWQLLDRDTREAAVNVGPLVVAQMPAFYAACDGVVFPSLNECFSVTPLEALRSARPLVAADRQFVREIGGDAPWYFEPTDPRSLADALVAVLSDVPLRDRRVELGSDIAGAWPAANDRALAYLDIIDRSL